MNLRQIRLPLIIAAIFAVVAAGSIGIVKINPVPALQSEISAITSTTTTTTSADSLSLGHKFIAKMTGDQEVPSPVDTDTTGIIKLAATTATTTNSQQPQALDYDLTLTNLNGVVTGGEIHIGKQGDKGPIVADLNIPSSGSVAAAASSSSGEGSTTTMTSSSLSGTITSADLKGPLEGKQIFDLVKLIEGGRTYANINTEQHPNGEIRGQILLSHTPSSSLSSSVSTSTSKSPSSAFASATANP